MSTAQFTAFVFHDNNPINNVPDVPRELGLAGFRVRPFDTADQILQDAFGNPVGTRYQVDADGTVNYEPDGSPSIVSLGDGTVLTDVTGKAVVRHLLPGKYEVEVVPPPGLGWQQTSTLEGTPFTPVWIRANEPEVFTASAFPPFAHAFFGFIQLPLDDLPATGTPGTVSGRIVNLHNGTPPDFNFYPGHPLPNCIVGLNDKSSGAAIGPCETRLGDLS